MSSRSNGRSRFGKKRLLMAVGYAASVAAVAALVTGATYGLFSRTQSSHGSAFTAGTVTLTSDATGSCSLSNMVPNGVASTCTLKATYSGSANAYMGLDVLIETQAGSGGSKLYNPADSANDLQIGIASTNPTVAAYTVPATATMCPGTAPSGSTCYEVDDELVDATPLTSANGAVTFTTKVSIPTSSTTGYQGGVVQIILTAHAVQSSNNAETSCTAGSKCSSVHWS